MNHTPFLVVSQSGLGTAPAREICLFVVLLASKPAVWVPRKIVFTILRHLISWGGLALGFGQTSSALCLHIWRRSIVYTNVVYRVCGNSWIRFAHRWKGSDVQDFRGVERWLVKHLIFWINRLDLRVQIGLDRGRRLWRLALLERPSRWAELL
jgi:hypothetical protein